jgi:hypothetical protein
MSSYINSGRCKDAVALPDRVRAEIRNRPEFLVNWGSALSCEKRPQEALEKVKQAAAIAPTAANYLVLAWAYRHLGFMHEADAAFGQAIDKGITTPYEQDLVNSYEEQTRARTVTR